jgi:fatty-acyl-CoA synthase
VNITPGAKFEEAEIRAHVREKLAGYKTPKRLLSTEISLRAPNGKADYKSASEFAKRALGLG